MDGLARASLMLLRRQRLLQQQLASNTTTNANANANAAVSAANTDALLNDTDALLLDGSESGSGDDLFATDDAAEEQAFTDQQLRVLAVNGVLSLVLFTALAAAVLWMTVVHFRSGSSRRKKAFHVVLFVSILLNVPDPLGWVLWPESDSWKPTYVLRVYGVLLQSACKSYLAFCWAEVVSAGRSSARRRVLAIVLVLNALLVVWAVTVPIILAPYPNDVFGQYDFMLSSARDVVTYTGVSVILAFGLLLLYQGMRLRGRLLQAKGMVPAGSVEKSLVQLLLTVSIIVTADALRVVSVYLSGKIPFTPLNVTNSLVPTIFPTICMLYLMRRVPRGKAAKTSTQATGYGNGGTVVVDATLSRFMAASDDSNHHSDVSDAYAARSSTKFAVESARVSAPQLSPPFAWNARGS